MTQVLIIIADTFPVTQVHMAIAGIPIDDDDDSALEDALRHRHAETGTRRVREWISSVRRADVFQDALPLSFLRTAAREWGALSAIVGGYVVSCISILAAWGRLGGQVATFFEVPVSLNSSP